MFSQYEVVSMSIQFEGMSRCSICGGTWEMCGCGAR